MDLIRLVTIHPMLVHLTLGGIPLMLIAYALAARSRSNRWLFAGDFVLFATALVTVLTGLFGFIAFFVIDWPGGLDLWRWLHLALGVATAGILWAMAIVRTRERRMRAFPNYQVLVGGSALSLAVSIAAGWVGGDLLVYRAGVAVLGARNGALAPPMPSTGRAPSSVKDAMGRIRGHFAAAMGEHFEMIVQRPTSERFGNIEREADRLGALARWLSSSGPRDETNHEMHAHAEDLGASAIALESAAHRQDLARVSDAIHDVQKTCASCHLEHRWTDEAMRAER